MTARSAVPTTEPLPPLRIVQVGMGWFPQQRGGLNRVFYQLCRHLPQEEVEVEALVDHMQGGDEGPGWSVRAVASPEAKLPGRVMASRRVLGTVLRTRPHDLVAVHFALTLWPAVRSVRPVPLVVHFHGPWAREGQAEGGGALKARMAWSIERQVYAQGCRFIVLSQAFGAILHRDYGVPEDAIRVVPGGVEANRFASTLARSEARRRLGWPEGRPVLLTVRRLVHRMGLDSLLSAVAMARRDVPDLWLAVVGEGPMRSDLQHRAADLDLHGAVTFAGALSDDLLPLAYRAADVSILPSVTLEGFGLPAVESLAAGTPVLGTPVGGIPETLSPLSAELICEGTAPQQIAERLVAVLRGAVRLPGEDACRAYARTGFDWTVVARRVRAVYDDALGADRP